MIDITLTKAKYRNPNKKLQRRQFDPPEGTWTFSGGGFKSKTSNQGTISKVRTLGPRRRSYGPW